MQSSFLIIVLLPRKSQSSCSRWSWLRCQHVTLTCPFLSIVVGPQAETGSAAAGRRRGRGGQRAPRGRAESAATPPSGAETLRRPSATETESERGNGTENERRRKRRGMMRKRRRSCWNRLGSAAPMLRTTTPTTPWTKWYCGTLVLIVSVLYSVANCLLFYLIFIIHWVLFCKFQSLQP